VSERLPWPIRSILAGTAGTAALSLCYELGHRSSRRPRGPLDYDDSVVPGRIVVSILNLHNVTNREKNDLGLALRWSYGSVFGLWHGILRRRSGEPRATAIFAGTLMSATLTMFPLLGRTPPPWRWPRGYLTTSLLTHAAYVAAVATVDDLCSVGCVWERMNVRRPPSSAPRPRARRARALTQPALGR
jgi:hypothetical protein